VLKMLRSVGALYNPLALSHTLVYMLQSVEYSPGQYLQWFWRTKDFAAVARRRTLRVTRVAKLLHYFLSVGLLVQSISVATWLIYAFASGHGEQTFFALALLASSPIVWAHVVLIPLMLGNYFVIRPQRTRQAAMVQQAFDKHSGTKIAIAGSYGKTSMKEILATVLGEGLKVAATPANMNVVSSHARFARSLKGNENVVLVEFGEGKPGDVKMFTRLVQPTHAVVTGLAPAHLDQYKTVQAAGEDIFCVTKNLPASQVFVNTESRKTAAFMKDGFIGYSREQVGAYTVSHQHTDLHGTQFKLHYGTKTIDCQSGLVGLHHIGPLAAAAMLCLELGLTEKQLKTGLAKTIPYEHRMQPYRLNGAWVIDDTYNGNLEGIRAGTALLQSLSGKRKLYVTPGLVEQGKNTARIHEEVGQLIAAANPDIVVLMNNSTTPHIKRGLAQTKNFTGEIIVQDDPLDFYSHLADFVAAGDIVLLQNDWTDNYA